MTNTFAVTLPEPVCGPPGSWYCKYLIWLTRPVPSTTTSHATVCGQIWTVPVFSACSSVTLGSYLAWMGQIGMQLVLPAQTRRLWYGWELRPAGVPVTVSGIPWKLVPFTPWVTASSTSEGRIGFMGYL